MTHYVNEKVAKMERPITAWVLLGLIAALCCIYAVFVAGAISNAVAAKDMTTQVSALSASVGELESRYLSAKSSVDLEYARSLGFSESGSATVYIVKKAGTASLSLNR